MSGRPALPGAAVALVTVLVTLTALRAEEPPPEIAWRTDLASATAEAAKSGQPLFVVFRCER